MSRQKISEEFDRELLEIKACLKKLSQIERNDRRNGKDNRSAILRIVISQLKRAQRSK